MGKMSRDKGKRWEQDIARQMREVFGDSVCRGWQAREGHDDPDLKNVPRQWCEAKHDEHLSVHKAMAQAIEALEKSGREGLWPVLYFKRNRTVPLVVMCMPDFMELLKEWWMYANCHAHCKPPIPNNDLAEPTK